MELLKQSDESVFWYLKNVFLGSKRNVIATITSAMLLGLCGFAYSNAHLPAEEKKIDALQVDIKIIKQQQQDDNYDKIMTKNSVGLLIKSQDDFKSDMKQAIQEINHRLDRIYDRTDETNKKMRTLK